VQNHDIHRVTQQGATPTHEKEKHTQLAIYAAGNQQVPAFYEF
jgi:hypothetical protein